MSSVHIEFHVSDVEKAKAFYSEILGWTFEEFAGMDYWMIQGEGIGQGQALSGALMPRNAPAHPAHTGPRGAVANFEVKDVDATYARALQIGGGEAMPPTDYEGVGRVAVLEDGQGNLFGIFQQPKGE